MGEISIGMEDLEQKHMTREFPLDPDLGRLVEALRRPDRPLRVKGVEGGMKALIGSLVARALRRPVVFVTVSEKEAKALADDLALFLGRGLVFSFPPWEIVSPDMFSFQREWELERVGMLYRLLNAEPVVTVIPVGALRELTMPVGDFLGYVRTLSIGETVSREGLITHLLQGGYMRETIVSAPGEFSMRGHIVDLFPPTESRGIRLEFVGDAIEEIREFDPESQRSQRERMSVALAPAREIIIDDRAHARALRQMKIRSNELGLARRVKEGLEEKMENEFMASVNPLFFPLFYDDPDDRDPLFAYFPPEAIVILDDEPALARCLAEHENAFDRFLHEAQGAGKFVLEHGEIFLEPEAVMEQLRDRASLIIDNLGLRASEGEAITLTGSTHLDLRVSAPGIADEAGIFAPVAGRIAQWLEQGYCIVIVCAGEEEGKRMSHLLAHYGLIGEWRSAGQPLWELWETGAVQAPITLLEGKLTGGFVYPPLKWVVIGEADIFGRKVSRRFRFRPTRESYFLRSFGELKEGDYVVHKDHGIGIYRGLEKVAFDSTENDFLLIEYAAGDKLLIPVDRLDRIQRYLGPEGHTPRLERLGGTSWETLKERVKESISKVAEDLVALYAARTAMDRRPFSPTDQLYEEFCALFEFEETPDQAKAIEDVHVDMNRDKPMDRLVCGDAGFGKTEVALRAAFRAVTDAKQVAVLTPTTILAEQHYQTFRHRFREFPVRVEVLDRLKSRTELAEVIRDINAGRVDIAIGTHRLLQKDVKFRDLGLLIIDEEQRFGVADKEKLKKLRTMVDVLTLSATPIPRTLHLALVGLRDLSIINTPPENRLPVKTYVVEFHDGIIASAIRQELARGGQVFFLHDRVRSIYTMARYVERLVPEAKVAVVHGQLKPREIEEAMVRFIAQEANVLVCTSIISAGIDIPTANTIIINRADRFGLSQLYQIRGRVGRFREEAYAYLLIPKGAMLSRDAVRRLQVLMDLTEPGSGFRIAASDLDIRGAGNLLGLAQSGHVSAVGYELYTELMEQTIRELKGEPVIEEEPRPEINLGISAFIPDSYMPDEHLRLLHYKRISVASSEEELAEIREELLDSHGRLPEEVENLFGIIRIRNLLRRIKGRKLVYNGSEIMLQFSVTAPLDPHRLYAMLKKKGRGARFSPDHVLTIAAPRMGGAALLDQIEELIKDLAGG